MRWGLAAVLAAVLAAGVLGPMPASAGPDEAIAWERDVESAFKLATEHDKIVMICINAKHAIGEPEEPAAKGLREIVYKDPKVVARSRDFVCVFLTRGGSSADFGELRARFGIDGAIVSPQHIFALPTHADGETPLVREEYWRYGHEEAAVKALLALMDRAVEARRIQEGVPEEPPADAAMRGTWIAKLVEIAGGRDTGMRRTALHALVTHDEKGDATGALLPLLDSAKDPAVLMDVVRALGIPDLRAAAPRIAALLAHKDAAMRANAAVSLEYIGCPTSVKPLLTRLKREKDAQVASHLSRAIGRCGVEDKAARKKLLRQADPGDDGAFLTYGAAIGLAYYRGDAKVARSVEKKLAKLGSPFQVGSKAYPFLRALLVWCLAEVGDAKSAKWIRKHLIKAYEDEKSHMKADAMRFFQLAAKACEGDTEARKAAEAATWRYMYWTEDARNILDDARKGRDMSTFVPKGEWGNQPKDDD
ncbi:MAG: HEAT repeat domain-containing protein [Planctomycetota bacterium]|nr:HEAT repeat domain-containing protein [Planctomycetota bacterium]